MPLKKVWIGIVLLVGLALGSAEPAKHLADLHKGKGVSCADCHGQKKGAKVRVDDSETVPNQACVNCHGDLKAVSDNDKHKGHIDPHQSHLGKVNCTLCHGGHQASHSYCKSCHGFDQKMPAGGEWKPVKPAPVTARQMKGLRPAERTDVVVIGSGATGMVAAITAHDAGARVIVLEKQPLTGGNSMLAAGGMNAAGTPQQIAKGIKDSADLMYDDTLKGGKNMGDPALVRILADQSAASVAWLQGLGADMSDVGRMGGASVNRSHRPSGGSAVGAHLAKVLKENAEKRKLDVRVNSEVVKVVEDAKGQVIGVLVRGKHRGLYRIQAKAVVLAAGGFSANPERVAHYQPDLAGMITSNQPGATGDGIDLGANAGGELTQMKEIQIHPSIAAGSRILITEAVRGNGAILVNREGKRFFNEIGTRDAVSQAILHQTGRSAFMIFDEGIRKSLKQIDGYFHLELVKEGDTPEALAKALGIPAEAFAATLDTYNKAVDAKQDAEFKRPDMPRALRTAKFYAIEVAPGI
ncbi:MAG: flavocytochrome c, partial [Firmicutes bacterium]|nr:flavocytochrome c [Bacillota bacterium]